MQSNYYVAKETAEIEGRSFDVNDLDYKIDGKVLF